MSTSPPGPQRIHPVVSMFAVVLPFFGLLAGAGTRLFQDVAFDPFPSVAYVILAAMGVFGALIGTFFATRDNPREIRLGLLSTSYALTASTFWAIAFLPTLPMIIVAVFAMGFGILAAAPYWGALGNGLVLARAVRQARSLGVGSFTPILSGVLLFALPMALVVKQRVRQNDAFERLMVTAHNHDRSADPDQVAEALSTLRSSTYHEHLLRRGWGLDYHRPKRAASLWPEQFFARVTGNQPVPPQAARSIYYRVTGDSFRDARVPAGERFDSYRDWWTRDSSMTVDRSEVRVEVDAAAALAHVAWKLHITNRDARDREARLRFKIPNDAVPTQLSLWIEGEKRRAAFAPRGQATKAYHTIVDKKKDPALLERRGDEVFLSVFPVPPDGTRQVRWSLTLPLTLGSETTTLPMPALVGANFVVRTARHDIEIQSQGRMESLVPGLEPVDADPSALRGSIPNAAWRAHCEAVAKLPIPESERTYATDQRGICLQRVSPRPKRARHGPLILVVEGSKSMRGAVDWHAFFDAVPDARPCHVLFAGDLDRERVGTQSELAEWLSRLPYEGGTDPVPLLERANQLVHAHGIDNTTVLWVHGNQPVARPGLPSSLEIAGEWLVYRAAGHDQRILDALPTQSRIQRVPAHAVGWTELARNLDAAYPAWNRRLVRLPNGASPPDNARRVRDNLCRFWAAREAEQLREADSKAAAQLALDYRLVTPWTAAVVLETEDQYERFGLDPDAESEVEPPILGQPVPEPSVWVLLLLGAGFVLWSARPRVAGHHET